MWYKCNWTAFIFIRNICFSTQFRCFFLTLFFPKFYKFSYTCFIIYSVVYGLFTLNMKLQCCFTWDLLETCKEITSDRHFSNIYSWRWPVLLDWDVKQLDTLKSWSVQGVTSLELAQRDMKPSFATAENPAVWNGLFNYRLHCISLGYNVMDRYEIVQSITVCFNTKITVNTLGVSK